jgi:hypothetical protein
LPEITSVRVRGHHLVCLHFYRGEGYDDRFVENLAMVLQRLGDGPAVVVAGADDVCAACAGLRAGLCTFRPDMEAEIRRLDSLAVRLLGVETGQEVCFAALRESLPDVLGEWRAQACAECDWKAICSPRMDASEA